MKNRNTAPFSALETSAFCDQLALILSSGVSALEGITIMLEDSESPAEKKILETILNEFETTGYLHSSLRAAGVFPEYMLSMTAIGEESGKLDDVMAQLAEYYERQDMINSSIRSTITYPAVMTCILAAVVIVLMTKVLPVFDQVFRQLGTELDGFSGALVSAGRTLSAYSAVLIGILLLITVAGIIMAKTESGRSKMINFGCRFPGIAKLRNNISACRFADGMSIALSSGLTPDRGMDLAASLINDARFGEKIEKSREMIENGEDMTKALTDCGVFSGLFSRIATIGEKTGSLDRSMARIASLYQDEIDNRINNLLATLEPTLVVVLTIVVGVVMLSVMMPLLGVLSGI